MTRCDLLQQAAVAVLEQHRALLDHDDGIRAVHVELRISPDGFVHTVNLLPRFEVHPVLKA